MSGAAASLWRVLPWAPGATAGRPFSATWVPAPTGRGRFDLPRRLSRVLYLAESPEHAVAEILHPWRGKPIDERHLVRAGRGLAVVEVQLDERSGGEGTADLCDPAILLELGVAPDQVASRHRSVTQPIARTVWDAGGTGLRWWSRFWGDWHTTVVFTERGSPGAAAAGFGDPRPLSLESPAVQEAVRLLGIEADEVVSPSAGPAP